MGRERTQGYPLEILSGTVPEKYICEECNKILRVPVQGPCGHRFCHRCVEQLCEDATKGKKMCPACMRSDEETPEYLTVQTIAPDHAIRRQLDKLHVRCPNKNCDWSGTLKSFQSHEQTCPHRLVACKCGELIVADRLALHQSHSCPASQSPSPMNSLATRMGELDLDNLRNKVERLELQIAMRGASGGDDSMAAIRRLEDKVMELEVVFRNQSGMGPASNSSFVKYSDLNQYKETLKIVGRKVTMCESLATVLNSQIQEIVTRMRELDDAMQTIQEQQKKTETSNRNLEMMLLSSSTRITDLEDKFRDIEQFTTYNGVFYWRLDNWKKKTEDAKDRRQGSIFSAPFYTDKMGYKMCLRLYPRGDGMGKDTHVSLFFVILKGPFDGLLQWPFIRKVTLTMIDQTAVGGDSSDSFAPDPNSSSFQRPTENMNVASGCPRFYDLNKLDQNAERFLVNDTMFIKAVIDSKDVQKR